MLKQDQYTVLIHREELLRSISADSVLLAIWLTSEPKILFKTASATGIYDYSWRRTFGLLHKILYHTISIKLQLQL